MNLAEKFALEITETERICDENYLGGSFRVLKTVCLVLFYPIALETISEVTSVANWRDCSEYAVFKRFGIPGEIEDQFGKYLRTNLIPPMIRQLCRNYLKDL